MADDDSSREELLRKLAVAEERIAHLERELAHAAGRAPDIDGPGESEARFRLLVDHSPDIIMTLDRAGIIRFVNRTLPEYSVEQVPGTEALGYVREEDRRRYQEAFDRALETATPQSLEHAAAGPSWWFTRLIPMGRDRQVESVLVVATDVTERKRAEEAKRHLELRVEHARKLESLAALAGGIAHDFNNLLTGILGSASLAKLKIPEGSPAEQQLERILGAADRAARLTNQLLAYTGKGRFAMSATDLNDAVRELDLPLQSSVTQGAKLTLSLAPNLPRIEADKTELEQVIMSLVRNAVDALEGGEGDVLIRTGVMQASERDDDVEEPPLEKRSHVFLEVSDTGTGMDEETRTKIFDPFFTTRFSRRGLGLAAVQGIVRAHRGRVLVSSKPQQGSTFTILFPALGRATESAEAPGDVPRGETILVIDDEESVRRVARASLEDSGFDVLIAPSGEQGLALFESHADEIGAVLLDLSMPHMSGEQVLEALRELRHTIPIVLTSGYSEEETAERIGENELTGFVQKPFQAAELVAEIRRALATRKATLGDAGHHGGPSQL